MTTFDTIRSEGGLLPPDLLSRIALLDKDVPGLKPEDYRLAEGERFSEAISRAWARLLAAWRSFQTELAKVPEDDPATTVTRERFLQPLLVELGFGRVATAPAIVIDDRSYAISHAWGSVPIHLLGARVSLEKKQAGLAGAARSSPHGLVQDLLNRSEPHLWALLSNGLVLRLLRDHHSLTTQAYVEIDLEAMFEEQRYADFVVLWLICHQSRFDAPKLADCWLERWFGLSRDEGVRALDDLRDGVERAIEALGAGFLRHPHNGALVRDLAEGTLDKQEYYRVLLRLVYRLIFLFSAEDRDVLLDPNAPEAARRRYHRFYATRQLRKLAGEVRGGPHGDLWDRLRVVMSALDEGSPPLGLPALGSFLWSREALPHLGGAALSNGDLLSALRALSYLERDHQRFPIAWRTVAADELGSIYEGLLELHPRLDARAGTFELDTAAGNERKKTGSYYTPTSLVDCLLDSALEPVIDAALMGKKRDDAEHALLALKVVDPACGSGHFLVAAARRLARRLASIRTGNDESSPPELRHAIRDVVGRCIFGVDVNEMAVELCKVALWMEAVEPGRPLSFLDAHIQCGDALLGATTQMMSDGIPAVAFKAIGDDDPEVAKRLKQRNTTERRGQTTFDSLPVSSSPIDILDEARLVEGASDANIDAIREKQGRWNRLSRSPTYRDSWFRADTWCAAFFWPKQSPEDESTAITHDLWLRICTNTGAATQATRKRVGALAHAFNFFHWHLAFPTVFNHEQSAGFDVIVGNPPWERVSLKEREYFAGRAGRIAEETDSSKRAALIARLETSDPALYHDFVAARTAAQRTKLFLSSSDRFPNTGVGDINTYALFSELANDLLSATGRAGIITQTQLVTEATYSAFTKHLVIAHRVVSCYAFENEKKAFPAAHHSTRFILLTIGHNPGPIEMATALFETSWLSERQRRYQLTSADIERMNPSTFALPQFRTSRDATIAAKLHANHAPLKGRTGLRSRLTISRVMHDKDDGAVISWDRDESVNKGRLPILESKLFTQYSHRFATYAGASAEDIRAGRPVRTEDDELKDSQFTVVPRKWVALADTPVRFAAGPRPWLLHIRKIARNIDWRTAIAAITPKWPNNGSCAWIRNDSYTVADYLFLLGVLNSFVFDYLLRQKVAGANVNAYQLFQVPIPALPSEAATHWHFEVAARAFELSYTCFDLECLAEQVGWEAAGATLPPFSWDPVRRSRLKHEVDSIVTRLYGVNEDELEWILDARPPSESFRVLREAEERDLGSFVTKACVLDDFRRALALSPSSEPGLSRLTESLRARHMAERQQIDSLPTSDDLEDVNDDD